MDNSNRIRCLIMLKYSFHKLGPSFNERMRRVGQEIFAMNKMEVTRHHEVHNAYNGDARFLPHHLMTQLMNECATVPMMLGANVDSTHWPGKCITWTRGAGSGEREITNSCPGTVCDMKEEGGQFTQNSPPDTFVRHYELNS